MAQQTAVKPRTTAPETTVPRAPKAAQKPKKTFDYLKFRQSIRSEKDFQDYLAGYPNKSGLIAYVYRLAPAIDFSLIGVGVNWILKTAALEEMTPDFIAQKFGRGDYMLKLNDANREKGQQEVCKTWFMVNDPDLVPIYDPRTLKLADLKNQDEILRLLQLGVLIRDTNGAPKLRTEADGTPSPMPQGASNGYGEILSKDVLGQVLLKVVTQGAQSPGDTMKQAIDIAKMLQPTSQPQLSVDQIAELVVTKLERGATRGGSGEMNLFESYERVEAFIQKIRPPAPPVAVAGEGASIWSNLAMGLLNKLDHWMPAVIQALGARAAAPPRRQNGRHQQPGEQQQVNIADKIAEIAQLGFQKMGEGINGFDYAAYVCNYVQGGLDVYRFLEPQGPAGVMGLAAMNPQTAPLLANPEKRAQVETFLSDFFSFDPDGSASAEPLGPVSQSAA